MENIVFDETLIFKFLDVKLRNYCFRNDFILKILIYLGKVLFYFRIVVE